MLFRTNRKCCLKLTKVCHINAKVFFACIYCYSNNKKEYNKVKEIHSFTQVQISKQLSRPDCRAERSRQSETFHRLHTYDHGKCILSIGDGFCFTLVRDILGCNQQDKTFLSGQVSFDICPIGALM